MRIKILTAILLFSLFVFSCSQSGNAGGGNGTTTTTLSNSAASDYVLTANVYDSQGTLTGKKVIKFKKYSYYGSSYYYSFDTSRYSIIDGVEKLTYHLVCDYDSLFRLLKYSYYELTENLIGTTTYYITNEATYTYEYCDSASYNYSKYTFISNYTSKSNDVVNYSSQRDSTTSYEYSTDGNYRKLKENIINKQTANNNGSISTIDDKYYYSYEYDTNGKESKYSKYLYNKGTTGYDLDYYYTSDYTSDKKSKYTKFDKDSVLVTTTEYTYNTSGRELSAITKDSTNTEIQRYESEYNSNNDEIKYSSYTGNKVLQYYSTYEYDANHNQTKKSYYFLSNGSIVLIYCYSYTYEYDSNNNKIKESYYDGSNVLQNYTIYDLSNAPSDFKGYYSIVKENDSGSNKTIKDKNGVILFKE